MAKLPIVKRIIKEDLKDAPSWIDRLIFPINQFFEAVYGALNKNISFDQNIICQIKSFEIKAGAAAINNTYSFAVTMNKKAEGLLLMQVVENADNYTPVTSAVHIDWTYINGNMVINSVTGLTNGLTYTFTVLLI